MKTQRRLPEEYRKELMNAAELTSKVYEVFYELRAISLAISATLLSIQKYLLKEIDSNTLKRKNK